MNGFQGMKGTGSKENYFTTYCEALIIFKATLSKQLYEEDFILSTYCVLCCDGPILLYEWGL